MQFINPSGPNSGNLYLNIFNQLVWISSQETFTVPQMAGHFNVHKNTVRKAINHLRAIGAIRCIKRNTTYRPAVWQSQIRIMERINESDRCKHNLIRNMCDICRYQLRPRDGVYR